MDQNNELDYAIKLNEWGYFPGPDICKCLLLKIILSQKPADVASDV